jgi:A/G-specific adenine glycosylase
VAGAAALLDWYDRHRRPLPWRESADPYRVWVSEVMLQQTRAETVVPYFGHFLARFPTLAALAAAPLEEVLACWSGLGYYRRARSLHRAARDLQAAGSGVPRTLAELRRLPGVGDYTAAAIASLAFGAAVPVLDGNVARVVARLLDEPGDPRRPPVRRRLLAHATTLLVPGRAGDSNQALMELGATLCTPRSPACPRCPLLPECAAAAAGRAAAIPPPRLRRPAQRVERLAVVVARDDRVLLVRREDGSPFLAGTWELPWVEAVKDAAADLARRYGGRWRLGPPLGLVRHTITHRRLRVEVRSATVDGETAVAEGVAAGWFDAAARRALPLSSLVGKVLRVAAAAETGEVPAAAPHA